eukprot:CAMPEP_0177782304 /NCGR_PEP_ID=MMETSP0491_2-20121128/18375_1 /TAXON_ID=63592 /ORGANISM="Tetraselmis chuii, Strain PLY429" /LENGTH=189 /DNA_ID=CAMNT_0019302553 /DNA_START=135 /DNA_END=700 /DNA_ORIENTATION=+
MSWQKKVEIDAAARNVKLEELDMSFRCILEADVETVYFNVEGKVVRHSEKSRLAREKIIEKIDQAATNGVVNSHVSELLKQDAERRKKFEEQVQKLGGLLEKARAKSDREETTMTIVMQDAPATAPEAKTNTNTKTERRKKFEEQVQKLGGLLEKARAKSDREETTMTIVMQDAPATAPEAKTNTNTKT